MKRSLLLVTFCLALSSFYGCVDGVDVYLEEAIGDDQYVPAVTPVLAGECRSSIPGYGNFVTLTRTSTPGHYIASMYNHQNGDVTCSVLDLIACCGCIGFPMGATQVSGTLACPGFGEAGSCDTYCFM